MGSTPYCLSFSVLAEVGVEELPCIEHTHEEHEAGTSRQQQFCSQTLCQYLETLLIQYLLYSLSTFTLLAHHYDFHSIGEESCQDTTDD